MRHIALLEIATWLPGSIPREDSEELDENVLRERIANWTERSGEFISNRVLFQPPSDNLEFHQVFAKAGHSLSENSEGSSLEFFQPGDEIEPNNSSYAFLEFNEEQPYSDEWEFGLYIFASFHCVIEAEGIRKAEQIARKFASSCFQIGLSTWEDPTTYEPEVVRVLEIDDCPIDISIWGDYCANCGVGLLEPQVKYCAKCGTSRKKAVTPGGEDAESLWKNLTQPWVEEAANSWFSEFEANDLDTTGSEEMKLVHSDFLESIAKYQGVVSKSKSDSGSKQVAEDLRSVPQFSNPTIFPTMELKLNNLNPVDIHESKLGKKLLEVLDEIGLTYVNTSVHSLPEPASGIFMCWPYTSARDLNLQWVRIYQDIDGKEFAFWHTYLLASNRCIDYRYVAESRGGDPFPQFSSQRFSSPEGRYSSQWGISSLLKNIAFMAETQFQPDAGMPSFSRELVFEGVPKEAWPKPAYAMVADWPYAYSQFLEDWEIELIKPSNMLLFGWTLTEDSLEAARQILRIVVTGCTYALEVMEDGESNNSENCTGLDWNSCLRQPAVLTRTMPEVYGQRYPAAWMTFPEYVRRERYIVWNYDDVYHSPSSEKRREGFENLLNNGTDRYVLHAANSLVFGEYLNSVVSSEEELETALEILALAFSLDPNGEFAHCQATNALINSGVLYYQAGKLELAEERLLAALKRSEEVDFDSSAQTEAHFVLSLIYEELGNVEKALLHRELGKGYGGSSKLRKPASKAAASRTSGKHQRREKS